AAAAIVTLFAYLYSLRGARQTAAREEALALAETRAQVIAELRERLGSVERHHRRTQADCERRIRELEEALEQTRREAQDRACQVQRLYMLALAESLRRLRSELEQTPPDIEGALATISDLSLPASSDRA